MKILIKKNNKIYKKFFIKKNNKNFVKIIYKPKKFIYL